MAQVFGSKKRQFGDRGEALAVKFLRRQKYRIVDRNVITGKLGELDIVAVHRKTLIFIEVKTRKSSRYGTPEEALSFSKLAKLERAIGWYLQHRGLEHVRYRLDVIAVDFTTATPEIRHHKGIEVS